MRQKSFRNGQNIDVHAATDRSLLYGDGVFTTIAINNQKPLLLDEHINRLYRDAKKIAIPSVSKDIILKRLTDALEQWFESSSSDNAIARITISRSSGGRGYQCLDAEPVYWINLSPWPTHIEPLREEGVSLRMCSQLLSNNPSLAGIKHCNRLEQVLARDEWRDETIHEGLMADMDGNIIEGTMSNFFIVKEGVISTPELSHSGVDGIMRNTVINAAKLQNLDIKIRTISKSDILSADAIFISNSIIEIWPVNRFDGNQYSKLAIITDLQSKLRSMIHG